MNEEIAKSLGLSPAQARLLRALFQYNDYAGQCLGERRRWLLGQLRGSDGSGVLEPLQRAGFLTRECRLTWLGLTVAVNLPALGSARSATLAA